MAELHKFKDDVRTEQGQSSPIKSAELDKNFTIVRLKISDNLAGFLKIKDNSPQPDQIEFVTPPPSSGEYAAVFNDGVFSQWMEIDECES